MHTHVYILLNTGNGFHFPNVILLIKGGPRNDLILLLQRNEVLDDQMPGKNKPESKLNMSLL